MPTDLEADTPSGRQARAEVGARLLGHRPGADGHLGLAQVVRRHVASTRPEHGPDALLDLVEFVLAANRPGVPFVNADVIAAQRWPDDPMARGHDAARAAAEIRDELLGRGEPFIAETVASRQKRTPWSRCIASSTSDISGPRTRASGNELRSTTVTGRPRERASSSVPLRFTERNASGFHTIFTRTPASFTHPSRRPDDGVDSRSHPLLGSDLSERSSARGPATPSSRRTPGPVLSGPSHFLHANGRVLSGPLTPSRTGHHVAVTGAFDGVFVAGGASGAGASAMSPTVRRPRPG